MTATMTAFGFADSDGVGAGTRRIAGPPRTGFRIKWSEISSRAFDRFGRLDAISKFALAAIELLALEESDEDRDEWGIVLGTEYGSSGVDAEFLCTIDAPGGASPLLFSYTLPSTLIGEAAMRHRLTGANLCISAGTRSGDAALWEAAGLVVSGEVEKCIAVWADAPGVVAREEPCFAYAFLIEKGAPSDRSVRARAHFCKKDASSRCGAGIAALLRALKEGRSSRVVIEYPYSEDSQDTLSIEVVEEQNE